MPELPEIETLKRCLEPHILGTIINKLDKRRDDIRYKLSDQLESNIIAAKIISLRRRAKYLIIDLDNGCSIIIHLGMSGKFTLQPNNYSAQKHDHVIISLNNGNLLIFNDPRRFGMISALPTKSLEHEFFYSLGVEPLSDNMSNEYIITKLAKRNLPIKNLMMDNKIIVGIGNIYASEILFAAKIDPRRLGSSLQIDEINKLILAIKNILSMAILAGGTTIKDFVSGDSKPGYFQQELQIYARENQQCLVCQGSITKLKQAGRASFYCTICQK